MRLLWLAHTRDLMDFLQGLVKTGKCEIVKQERSKFVSFLFLRERWRGLFVKHFSPPKSWSTGSTMLTLTQGASSSSSVVWLEGGTSKINVSIFRRQRQRYLLVRFPDYLDRPTAPELSKQIEASLVDGADATPFYDSWSDK